MFENDYLWTEKVHGRIVSFQNSNAVKFVVSNALRHRRPPTFGYWDLTVR